MANVVNYRKLTFDIRNFSGYPTHGGYYNVIDITGNYHVVNSDTYRRIQDAYYGYDGRGPYYFSIDIYDNDYSTTISRTPPVSLPLDYDISKPKLNKKLLLV